MMRRGFTFTELMLTVVIVGCGAALGIPKSDDIERRGSAAEILSDVDAIRKATFRFFSDSGYFPREEIAGIVPEAMAQYLPRGFSFRRKAWIIDYDYWTTKQPSVHLKTGVKVGVTITIPDARLGSTAMSMYGNNPKFRIGSKHTFLIVGL
jgi:prepilin-type N-terminal cleavage/methylation domain-containing protein